jgi:SAM-dependent methyltransferase
MSSRECKPPLVHWLFDMAQEQTPKFISWEDAVAWLIEQPDKQDMVRECYYDPPLTASAERYWRSEEWSAVRPYLPTAKGAALDIGAGRGITTFAMTKDGWNVTALEPDPSNLVGVGAIKSLFQESGLKVSVVQEFGEGLPFPDNHFDLVFTRQVLHHARDLPQLCREISRVLKPGGTFIGIRDHVLHKKSDLEAFLQAHPLHNLYGGENAYLLQEYLDALRAAPLQVRKVLRSFETPIHYDTQSLIQVRSKLKDRLSRSFVLRPLGAILASKPVFESLIPLMSRFDRRPGAAVSFICYKPGAEQ